MSLRTILPTTLLACWTVAAVYAIEVPKPDPGQKEHAWLKQLVGPWEVELEAKDTEGKVLMQCKQNISYRMLGNLWVVADIEMLDGQNTILGLQTIGYDPKAKQYVGTWVDSMHNHLWNYSGSVDEAGKKLTLEATGPNMLLPPGAVPQMVQYRDAYELVSPDEMKVESSMQMPDGKWMVFMSGKAVRKQQPAAR
ncbi:MAG: DUF1579 domain-containing protein [Pirellulales bacterium]|nr:DUF1579 domain-containing protein [Pirellulales bacterium]